MALPERTRAVLLASRPEGEPSAANFEVCDVELRPPGADEVTVRNTFMSVDPYMRGRMNDVKSYVAPFAVGEVLQGAAVGEVIESRNPDLSAGDVVLHFNGWRQHTTDRAAAFRRIDTTVAPAQAYLGVLGVNGLSAWVGVVDIGAMRAGDVVFVSGAAGGVGSIAGQVARLRGASRVVGSAGSDEKVAHLIDDLGFDAAFNHRTGPIREQLRRVAPDGIDLYFDNVGGDHLEAALGALHTFGRVAVCGAISEYNATAPPPGPRNLSRLVISRRLTLRGFLVTDHMERHDAFITEVGGWLRDGTIRARETIIDGIENAPAAFLGMLHGDNTGKMLVRLA